MTRIYAILLFSLQFSYTLFPQELNQLGVDDRDGSLMLLGKCNRDGFVTEAFAWFDEEYTLYLPDRQSLETLSPEAFEGLTITVVLGTWCSDSKREVPRFFRIFDELGLDDSILSLICVDRTKQCTGEDISQLKIELVPTFIFYRNGVETGRIIETPTESLEKDLSGIMSGK